MRFIAKVKQVVTGKTEIERKQEAAANKIIRAEANAAALQERRKLAIELAKEREKLSYKKRTDALKNPRGMFSPAVSGFSNYGSVFGSPRFKKDIPKQIKRKGKKIKEKNYIQEYRPQRVDLISGNEGYRVI